MQRGNHSKKATTKTPRKQKPKHPAPKNGGVGQKKGKKKRKKDRTKPNPKKKGGRNLS
jgi:hypothetical protein